MQVLNGAWRATEQYGSSLDFTRLDFDDSGWEEIIVPGHWQEHPGFAHYPEKMLFRKKFHAEPPPENHQAVLRFEGVFYFTRVWVNGVYLGEHTGYFEPFEFDVSHALTSGENVVSVFVRCTREKDVNAKTQVLGVYGHWDCIPKHIQPGGIWGEVKLFERPVLHVASVSAGDFNIEDRDEATLCAQVRLAGLTQDAARGLRLAWTLSPANFDGGSLEGEILADTLTPDDPEASFEIAVPSPRLWWTWDRGRPNLYRLEVVLTNEAGEALHSAHTRFGIRTLEMNDWILKLNGRSLFCRGSNYAPGDVRIAVMDRDRFEQDIRLIRDANLNMIRVHAHVERPEFYDLCDEYGILVWQDFPLIWFYSQEIEEKAVDQVGAMVRLLAGHASVALWCCHNEPYRNVDAQSALELIRKNKWRDLFRFNRTLFFSNWNKNELDEKLRSAVEQLDASRPVVSASGIPGITGEGTDAHLYFGWYIGTMRGLAAFSKIYRRALRFVTEYGAQAYPITENFRKIQNAETVADIDWMDLEDNYLLQKKYMDKFVPPKKNASLDEYIGMSQWYQARVTRYFTEMLRRYKYTPCGGSVHFLFNDCLPGVTWSVVDYWRGLKQGYYALRDSMRPLLPVAELPRRWYPQGELISLRLFVINDLLQEFSGAKLSWTVVDDRGATLAGGETVCDVAADSVRAAGRVRWDSEKAPDGGYGLVLELSGPGLDDPVISQYEFELRGK